jgi:hypothetical protein
MLQGGMWCSPMPIGQLHAAGSCRAPPRRDELLAPGLWEVWWWLPRGRARLQRLPQQNPRAPIHGLHRVAAGLRNLMGTGPVLYMARQVGRQVRLAKVPSWRVGVCCISCGRHACAPRCRWLCMHQSALGGLWEVGRVVTGAECEWSLLSGGGGMQCMCVTPQVLQGAPGPCATLWVGHTAWLRRAAGVVGPYAPNLLGHRHQQHALAPCSEGAPSRASQLRHVVCLVGLLHASAWVPGSA